MDFLACHYLYPDVFEVDTFLQDHGRSELSFGGNKFQPFCGRGKSKQKMNIFGNMYLLFPVFHCTLRIRICSTHTPMKLLIHLHAQAANALKTVSFSFSKAIPQELRRYSADVATRHGRQQCRSHEGVMGIMNNAVIRQLTTTGRSCKNNQNMQDVVVMSSDESVELVSSHLCRLRSLWFLDALVYHRFSSFFIQHRFREGFWRPECRATLAPKGPPKLHTLAPHVHSGLV